MYLPPVSGSVIIEVIIVCNESVIAPPKHKKNIPTMYNARLLHNITIKSPITKYI